TDAVRYVDGGPQHYGLSVTDAQHQKVSYGDPPAQIADGGARQVAANSMVVVAEVIDLNRHHALNKPGKYFVTWNTLRVGKTVPFEEPPGRFGERSPRGVF